MFYYKEQSYNNSTPDTIIRDIGISRLGFRSYFNLEHYNSYWWGNIPLSTLIHTLKQEKFPEGSIILAGSLLYNSAITILIKYSNKINHCEIYWRERDLPALKFYNEQNYVVQAGIYFPVLIDIILKTVPGGCLLKRPLVVSAPQRLLTNLTILIDTMDSYIKSLGFKWWGIINVYDVENLLLSEQFKTKSAIIFRPAIIDCILCVAVKIKNDEVAIYYIEIQGERYISFHFEFYWCENSPRYIIELIMEKEKAVLISSPELITDGLTITDKLMEFKNLVDLYFWGIIEGDSGQKNQEDCDLILKLKENEAIIVYHDASQRSNYLITVLIGSIKYEICYSNIGYKVIKNYNVKYPITINFLSDLFQNVKLLYRPVRTLYTLCKDVINGIKY